MIAKTLMRTKEATFAIQVPNPTEGAPNGFPTPWGTGFFITRSGYFITARHVIIYKQNRTERYFDIPKITLDKPEFLPSPKITGLELIKEWADFDIALLKADFGSAKNKDYFKNKEGFDYIEPDFNIPMEGSEVYSFGYPLSDFDVRGNNVFTMGIQEYRPRVTSAIVSSHYEKLGFVWGAGFPKDYVIDKALNWGNSGAPIVLQENGKAISICTRFEPLNITQLDGSITTIPSLYGVTSSLKNIEEYLKNII
jgi:serine protease Do